MTTRSQAAQPSQRSFDISVNVLNGISDKLLLSDKIRQNQCKQVDPDLGKLHEQGKLYEHGKPDKHSQKSQSEAALLTIAQSMAPPALPCRPSEMPLEISLLTVPISCLLAGIVLYRRDSSESLVCTLASCFIVLGVPAFLLVAHPVVKKHMYVHLLLIHEAALFVILQKRFVTLQCIVFALVFAHVSVQQSPVKPVLFFVSIVNAATLLVFENAIPFPNGIGVDTLCGSIVLGSAVMYASYVMQTSYWTP